MPQSVYVLGDTAVDLIIFLPEVKDGVKIMAHVPCLYPGGSGANTAVALARLGIPTQFIGTVGEDQYGQVVKRDFMDENVGIEQLFVDSSLNTVCVFAFVDKNGERFLWGYPREDQSYSSIDFDKIDLEKVKKAGWLHTTGILLANESSGQDTTVKMLEWANKNDVVTSFDLNLRVGESGEGLEGKFREVVQDAVSSSKFILGSDQEFALLDPSMEWENTARKLAARDKIIVVRQGKDGSILLTKDQRIESSAFQINVVDTIGAGDIYDAGFIAALMHGEDYAAALQWGNAVAAYAISKEGARTSPTFEQMKDFINQKMQERK